MRLSTLEHRVPEYLFSTSDHQVEAVSSVKAISLAAQKGRPIYTIASSNIEAVLKLDVDQSVKYEPL